MGRNTWGQNWWVGSPEARLTRSQWRLSLDELGSALLRRAYFRVPHGFAAANACFTGRLDGLKNVSLLADAGHDHAAAVAAMSALGRHEVSRRCEMTFQHPMPHGQPLILRSESALHRSLTRILESTDMEWGGKSTSTGFSLRLQDPYYLLIRCARQLKSCRKIWPEAEAAELLMRCMHTHVHAALRAQIERS